MSDLENTLIMKLDGGEVTIAMRPDVAPSMLNVSRNWCAVATTMVSIFIA